MTIGGKHTIAELSDLLEAKDPLIPALEQNWRVFHPIWMQTNPGADAAFKKDLDDLKSRYSRETLMLHTVIDAVPSFMENITPAEDAYAGVISALQKHPGVVSPGDLQDLWNRLNDAVQANQSAHGLPPAPLYEPPTLQPRKTSDIEETAYKNLGWLDPTAKKGKETFGWLAVVGALGLGIFVVLGLRARPSIVVVAPKSG